MSSRPGCIRGRRVEDCRGRALESVQVAGRVGVPAVTRRYMGSSLIWVPFFGPQYKARPP